MRRYVVGLHGPVFYLGHDGWTPPLGAPLLLAVVVAASAGLAWLGYRLAVGPVAAPCPRTCPPRRSPSRAGDVPTALRPRHPRRRASPGSRSPRWLLTAGSPRAARLAARAGTSTTRRRTRCSTVTWPSIPRCCATTGSSGATARTCTRGRCPRCSAPGRSRCSATGTTDGSGSSACWSRSRSPRASWRACTGASAGCCEVPRRWAQRRRRSSRCSRSSSSGGSVLAFLASRAWVYHEAVAWGIALDTCRDRPARVARAQADADGCSCARRRSRLPRSSRARRSGSGPLAGLVLVDARGDRRAGRRAASARRRRGSGRDRADGGSPPRCTRSRLPSRWPGTRS